MTPPLPNRRYDHLFFDLDHTLWDFETNSRETLADLHQEAGLAERGIPDFESFVQTYNRHNAVLWDRFRKGFISREDLRWKRMWRTLLEFRVTDEALARQLSERYLEILPTKRNLFLDTIAVLDYLRGKGYPMHLITNGFERTQHAKLRNSGIDVYFTYVVTSEAAGIMKPHAPIFEYAMRLAGTGPDRSVMIGDTLDADILGANNAGMDTVYFNPQVPADGDIRPTYVIASLGELKRLL
jgi:putative hydrolase of the HAD superfamily